MKANAGVAWAAALVVILSGTAWSQGRLTPPGPPAPTMRTLEQIEPRIPVDDGHTPGNGAFRYRITEPGSYYLTENLIGQPEQGGISIETENVTLDLNGFALIGVSGSNSGVYAGHNTTSTLICNGSIRGWGINGIDAYDSANGHFDRLRASGNRRSGLYFGAGSTVENCSAEDNGDRGIFADFGSTIRACTARGNKGTGMLVRAGSTVSGCSVRENSNGGIILADGATISHCAATKNGYYGFWIGDHSTVDACAAAENGGPGIFGTYHLTIKGCAADGNTSHGIHMLDHSVVSDCTANDNDGSGIAAGAATITHCTVDSNELHGIDASNSTILGCTAHGNTLNGIWLRGGTIRDCTVSSNQWSGILGCGIIADCTANENQIDGISISGPEGAVLSRVTGNRCTLNGFGLTGGAGIHVTGNGSFVQGNHVASNWRGIAVNDSGNMIVGTTATRNDTNYDIVAGNKVGAVVSPPNSPAFSGNTGGAGAGTADPWANFAF